MLECMSELTICPLVAKDCAAIIDKLNQLHHSHVGTLIDERAREGRMPGHRSMECWSEFRHMTSRITAYLQSVKFLLIAKKKWPKLFNRFTVSFLRSSRPMAKPIRNKSLAAESIVGRMTRKAKDIEIFRNFVLTLQMFDLNERIINEYQKESFRPIVHSEILLLDWLKNEGGVYPGRFFNGWMYIGSSKPTCKLCHYYFEEDSSEIEHRPTHGNVYPPWRFPDVLPSHGPKGEEARQIMVDKILLRVRKDAFAMVRKKVPSSYKKRDSNTFSATVTLDGRWSLTEAEADLGQIASVLSRMDLNGVPRGRILESIADEDNGDYL